MFHEIFDWTDMHDSASKHVTVKAGEVITAAVDFKASDNSYEMSMSSSSGGSISYNYPLRSAQKTSESVGYFVLEHQPGNCDEYPPNGKVTWTDIKIEVDGDTAGAKWEAKQEQPACSSKVTVVDQSTIELTWEA